jgi:hypothetical protein
MLLAPVLSNGGNGSRRSVPWAFLSLVGVLLSGSLSPSHAENEAATVVEFELNELGQVQRVTITQTPTYVRVDLPKDKWSVIYRRADRTFIGLEHRDGKYWRFDWPAVEAAAKNSPRAGDRFRNLLSEGLSDYTEPGPGTTNAAPALPPPPRYQWEEGEGKKNIGSFATRQWRGRGALAEKVEAWCTEQKISVLPETLETLKLLNEPLALAAVRPLFPPQVFQIFDSLIKAEVTPVEIIWGKAPELNHCTYLRTETRQVDPSFFQAPRNYSKTELFSLEGLLKEAE